MKQIVCRRLQHFTPHHTHDIEADELSKCTYSTVLTTMVTRLMMRPISKPILTLNMIVAKNVMIQVIYTWLEEGVNYVNSQHN